MCHGMWHISPTHDKLKSEREAAGAAVRAHVDVRARFGAPRRRTASASRLTPSARSHTDTLFSPGDIQGCLKRSHDWRRDRLGIPNLPAGRSCHAAHSSLMSTRLAAEPALHGEHARERPGRPRRGLRQRQHVRAHEGDACCRPEQLDHASLAHRLPPPPSRLRRNRASPHALRNAARRSGGAVRGDEEEDAVPTRQRSQLSHPRLPHARQTDRLARHEGEIQPQLLPHPLRRAPLQIAPRPSRLDE